MIPMSEDYLERLSGITYAKSLAHSSMRYIRVISNIDTLLK